jgi:hypothetical protein
MEGHMMMNKLSALIAASVMVAGGSLAFAQAKKGGAPAEPKAPEAKKAPDSKPAPVAPEMPKMEMPTPAPEIAEAFKGMKGTWKCSGKGFDPLLGASRDWAGTVNFKTDLGGFWIVMTGKEKKSKAVKNPMMWTEYRTFDAASKKWVAAGMDNMGMLMQATGTTNGDTTTWSGKGSGGGMTMHMKGTETHVGPKETALKFDMSMDGKNWMTAYEGTCKR